MAEQQATTPVDVAPEEPSFESKLSEKVDRMFGEPEPQEPQSEPSDEAPAEEAGSEGEETDIEVEDEAPNVDEEVIIHRGQEKRVSKEQMRALAQKGFDYETNMAEVKSEREKLQSIAKGLQAQQQLTPQLLEAAAEIKAVERELAQYANVDWVRLATDDPLEYPKWQARYQQLQNAHSEAGRKFQTVANQKQTVQNHITEEQLALERKRLESRIPEWKDSERYQKESAAILKAVTDDYGISLDEIGPTGMLGDHRVIALLRDAWKYRQAVANSKAKKGQIQGLPQMPKPGVPQKPRDRSQEKVELTRKLHRATDPRQKKELLDAVLMKKLGF